MKVEEIKMEEMTRRPMYVKGREEKGGGDERRRRWWRRRWWQRER